MLKEALLEITPEDMNAWIHSWATDSNQIIVVSGNDKDYKYLTKDQALDVMAKVAEKDIQPETIERKTPEGFDLKLQGGTIKKVKKLDRFKAEEWTLSNGARVFYKHVEEGNGFFSMACSSHGGRRGFADAGSDAGFGNEVRTIQVRPEHVEGSRAG